MNKLLFTTILLASLGLYARENKEDKPEEIPTDRNNPDHSRSPDHSQPHPDSTENNIHPTPRNRR